MTWIAYLILLHLLAIPGVYMALGLTLTFMLSTTTNVLTGETLPWARGMGWLLFGAGLVGCAWFMREAWR